MSWINRRILTVTASAYKAAGEQGMQRDGLRRTRVRGVPRAGEALGVVELGGGHETCKASQPLAEICRFSPVCRDAARLHLGPGNLRLQLLQPVETNVNFIARRIIVGVSSLLEH